jgi:hypothetical protein
MGAHFAVDRTGRPYLRLMTKDFIGRLAGGVAALLGVAGCAHAPATQAAPPGSLVLHAESQFVHAQVTPSGIQGPQFNVTRTGTALRGTVYNRAVNVDVNTASGDIHGLLGMSPVDVHVQRDANGVRAKGLIGGYLSDFVERKDVIQGRIGGCSYDLRFVETAYQGFRNCGGSRVEQLSLQVPSTLASWSDAELTAGLALFLTSGAGRSGFQSSTSTSAPPRPMMEAQRPEIHGTRPPLH